ncbi:MAG: DNA gyrase modulator, partial [Candidatus Micrarchaeota archaeon]
MERKEKKEGNLANAEKILSALKKSGAEDAVVSIGDGRTEQTKFVNNEVISFNSWSNISAHIFAVFNARIVSTSLDDFSEKEIARIAKKAANFSRHLKPNKEFRGIANGPFNYQPVPETYDSKLENFGERGIDLVNNSIERALANGAKRTAGVLKVSSSHSWLATSGNIRAQERGTSAYFSLRAFVEADASGHQTACSCMLKKLEAHESAERAAELAKLARNPKNGKEGVFNLIIEPLPLACFLDEVGSSASIFSAETGHSFLNGKLGKRVA